MTATTATTSVRTYTIVRDMWEAGDCQVCATCGRNIRHVTEINGTPYGTRCAAVILEAVETPFVEAVSMSAMVETALTIKAIDALVASPMRKSILRTEWMKQQQTAAAVYFTDKAVITRLMAQPAAQLEETYQARRASGAATAEGFRIMAELKRYMERGR